MTIEIKTSELERLMQEEIQRGGFRGVEDLLTQVLHALREKSGSALSCPFTGEALVTAMQSSPYKEINLDPVRYRLPVRDPVF